MNNSENRRAPSLGGWIIAAGAGLVAAAVSFVAGHLDYSQSGFIGVGIFLLVGLILGMYWGSAAAPAPMSAVAKPVAPAATAAPAMPAATFTTPVMAEAAPAAFMSAPMADAAPVLAKAARVAQPKTAKPVVTKVAAKPAAPKVAKAKKPDGPVRLSAPRKGKADDLKEIEGIGPALE